MRKPQKTNCCTFSVACFQLTTLAFAPAGNEDSRGGSGRGGGGAAAPVSTLRQRAEAETQAGVGGHGLDLSRNGKTLLVAAYLASHNSRETGGFLFLVLG